MKKRLIYRIHKITRVILLLLLCTLMLFSQSSCEFEENISDSSESKSTTTYAPYEPPVYEYPAYIIREDEGYIKGGFITVSIPGMLVDDVSEYFIAYKIPEVIDCNDETVAIELFYGTLKESNSYVLIGANTQKAGNSIEIDRIIAENFNKETHKVKLEKVYKYGNYYKTNFGYSQVYDIPVSYFSDEAKLVYFTITPIDEQGNCVDVCNSVALYFNKVDGQIKFYTEYDYNLGG